MYKLSENFNSYYKLLEKQSKNKDQRIDITEDTKKFEQKFALRTGEVIQVESKSSKYNGAQVKVAGVKENFKLVPLNDLGKDFIDALKRDNIYSEDSFLELYNSYNQTNGYLKIIDQPFNHISKKDIDKKSSKEFGDLEESLLNEGAEDVITIYEIIDFTPENYQRFINEHKMFDVKINISDRYTDTIELTGRQIDLISFETWLYNGELPEMIIQQCNLHTGVFKGLTIHTAVNAINRGLAVCDPKLPPITDEQFINTIKRQKLDLDVLGIPTSKYKSSKTDLKKSRKSFSDFEESL